MGVIIPFKPKTKDAYQERIDSIRSSLDKIDKLLKQLKNDTETKNS